MLPSNIRRDIFGQIGSAGVNTQSRQSWQWQPTLTVHDPNPPITLENPAPASLVMQTKPLAGLVGR